MGQENQKWDKIENYFFNFPQQVIGLRELSRIIKISKTTLRRYLQQMVKQKLIKLRGNNYIANSSNFWYQFDKRNKLLKEIYESGLVEFIQAHTQANTIILFGSGAKGEYVKESDLDIFEIYEPSKYVQPQNFDYYIDGLKKSIRGMLKTSELRGGPKINPIIVSSSEHKEMILNKEVNVAKEVLLNHIILKGFSEYWREIAICK